MKKFSKRLTMIVAILLSLVLLSSSIVSTTLAKYVITKDATTSVGLEKFGLTVTLEKNVSSMSEITAETKKTGDSISLTYNKVSLTPGSTTYQKAIKASIAGTATVDAKVTITVDITCDDTKYKITSDDFSSGYSTAKVVNPIQFYVADSTSCDTAYKEYSTNSTNDALSTGVETAIATKLLAKVKASTTGVTSTAQSGNTVTGTITGGTTAALSNINLGFVWPNTSGKDELGTFIASKSPSFTIKYTITVEQVETNT